MKCNLTQKTILENNIIELYSLMYIKPRTRAELAEHFGVTERTIINWTSIDDFGYDKKIKKCIFKVLLPSIIPLTTHLYILMELSGSVRLKDEYRYYNKISGYIETEYLDTMFTKIIKLKIAITNQYYIKIDYFGNKGIKEVKHIAPRKVFFSKGKIYLFAEYTKENYKNIGKSRVFSISGINSIEPYKRVTMGLESNEDMNQFGPIVKDRYITLVLRGMCANYFKKEGVLLESEYEFIHELPDGSIVIKFFYSNVLEPIKLIQLWMPLIQIDKRGLEDEEVIIEKINKNIELYYG